MAQSAKVGGSNPLAPTLFLVYIIFSPGLGRYYVGSTQDLANRLREHNAGKSLSTRAGTPWELVFSKSVPSRSEAVRLERNIKARGIKCYLGDIDIANSG